MRDRALIVSLLVIGLIIRVVALESIPPGLWSDEANHGLEANEILHGASLPIFFPGNCGQEPLFKYLIVVLTALLGPGAFTLRLAAALAGWLLLPLTWVLARRCRGASFAILTLFFLTFGVWHLHFSRLAFRAILGPTLSVLALLAADSARVRRSVLRALVAGIAAGALWYTYPAFRLMSIVPLLWLLLTARKGDRLLRALIPFGAGFIVTLLPLLFAWKGQPELFTARASMAALWTETPDVARGIVRNTVKHLGMFLFSGDSNWRHNLSRAPQLGVITGFFFLIGVAVAFARRSRFDVLLLVWGALMLVPGILSVERQAPHCLRTIGVLPAPYLLAAQGVLWFKERMDVGARRNALVIVLLALVPILTLGRYFVAWPTGLSALKPAEESLFGFNRQENALGQWLKDREESSTAWLSPQLFLHPTTAYTAGDADYRLVKDARDLQDGDLVVMQLTERNLWWLRDDFRKNFFIWWWQNGRATKEETWTAISNAYPQCGDAITHTSDQYTLSLLLERYRLEERLGIAGLTVMEVKPSGYRETHRTVWPAESWRRLPSGCFSVTIDSLHPNLSAITLVAKEEGSSKSWILDRIDNPQCRSVTLSGCLLFPSCARIQCAERAGEPPIEMTTEWAYTGAPDLEPYLRQTLWGTMRATWARLRRGAGL